MARITPPAVAEPQTYFFPNADGTNRPVSVEAANQDDALKLALAKLDDAPADAPEPPAEPTPTPEEAADEAVDTHE